MQSIQLLPDGTHPRNILRDYIDAAETEIEFYKHHGQQMTDVGNGLYRTIVARLEPHFQKGSRDLEWDVLPGTVGALAKRAEAAEARFAELVETDEAEAQIASEEIARLKRDYQTVCAERLSLTTQINLELLPRIAELEAQNTRLREALWFLLMGYEGLGGDMHNNAPRMAKAALADTKGTP